MAELAIVVPAHNEARRIAPALEAYCSYFGDRANVIVVLNGCTDGTAAVVTDLAKRHQNLSMIEASAPIGKGGAVRIGLMASEQPYVGFVDADGSYGPEQFDRLFKTCAKLGLDGVIGLRDPKVWQRMPGVSPLRRSASRVYKMLCRALFRLPFTDTQCGAKVFRRPALESVLTDLELANFAFDVDLLYQLQRQGAKISQLSIEWDEKAGSKINLFLTSASMLQALLRLRIRRSPLGTMPLVDLIARQSVIAVSTATRVLLVGEAQQLASHLRSESFNVEVWRSTAGPASHRWPALVLNRARFALWYLFESDRRYDVIIEAASGVPFMLPCVSASHSFVLDAPVSRLAGIIYNRLYRMQRRVEFCPSGNFHRLTEKIRIAARRNGPASARLLWMNGALTLTYVDRASGEEREQAIPL